MNQGRRRGDVNLFTYVHRLFSGERVETRVRWASAALAVIYALMGWGPLFSSDEAVWDNPAFNGIFTLALPQVWGAGFFVAAIMFIGVATSRRAILYLWSSVVGSAMVLGWMIGVTAEVLTNEEAKVTSTAFGLYGFSLVAMSLYVTMAGSLEANVEIFERVGEDHYEPLRLVDRRKAG